MAKRKTPKRKGRCGPPEYRRISAWLTEEMARRLDTHAAAHRTRSGVVIEEALEAYLGGSHYRDQSRGSVGSGNPSGSEPPPAPPALHVSPAVGPEGDGSAAA